MDLYLNYPKYQDMGGRLSLDAYTDLAIQAQMEIDWYTFGRIKKFETIPDEVEWCVFKLVQLLASKQSAASGGTEYTNASLPASVASQSNDGVSVSYNTLSASEIVASSKSEMEAIIQKYLNTVRDSLGRRVLYRGLYGDE